jgi:glucose/arabinose dehydrogenase/PKD repeat protein
MRRSPSVGAALVAALFALCAVGAPDATSAAPTRALAVPLSASYVSNPPTTWAPGQVASYPVTVTNTGTQTWPAGGTNAVHLTAYFGGSSDACCTWTVEPIRFNLPNDIAPGGSATVTVTLAAPTATGSYILRNRMVQEGVAWFDTMQKINVTVATSSDTTPPVISAIQTSNVLPTGATVTWTTNEPADSQVEYGQNTGYGLSTVLAPADVTAHSVDVTALQGGTLYHYRVKSRDAAGNLTTSADKTFTTAPTQLPPGFSERVVFSGLTNPTAVRFSPDGRVFVAERSGLIKVFASLTATTPTVVADLRTNVFSFWDRGLLGMELAPNFPTNPYIYVLYTYDAVIGGTAPKWGTPGATSDGCPTPPGPTTDGCVVSGRLSRLQISGNVMTGPEQVLINSWCQQFPSHSIGNLTFASDGSLIVTGGEGASFDNVDYGQLGNQYPGDVANPCGDPPNEGGALRSQSVRRPAGEPVLLDGSVLRVDANTGAGVPTNALASRSDANAKRIIGYGLRNPFRATLRPGTNEIWVGDVGWSTWEEINVITDPTATPPNFGWPCYEGNARQPGYSGANLSLCTSLYSQEKTATAAVGPYYTYNHNAHIVQGEACPFGSSSVTGLAFDFYNGGNYPATYDGALFFSDTSRKCIWAMLATGGPRPNPANIVNFVTGAANPVDLQIGPGGDVYYVDFDTGTIRRIVYSGGANTPPVASLQATPTNGLPPLTVSFDGTASSDPDPGDSLTYSWDLNGDGIFGDATTATTSFTYTQAGTYTVSLRVTDLAGASNTATTVISTNNTPPAPTIATPVAATNWKVGDVIPFSGSATDQQDGNLPASALSWSLIVHHCPSNCHTHLVQTFPGVASGTFTAPDHEYPSYLELQLTATDSGGLSSTTSVQLDPTTTTISLNSSPPGLQLGVATAVGTTPFVQTVILGSTNVLTAGSPQSVGGTAYQFASWSDGGAATHSVIANGPLTLTATYTSSAQVPLSAGYVSSPPTTWAPGQVISYPVTVTNTGTQTWPAGGTTPVHLGVYFGDTNDACCTWTVEPVRFNLANDVAPGGSATVTVTVAAPTTAGSYILRHRMVQENVAWFDSMQKTNVTVGTSGDTTPPVISAVQASNVQSNSATVTWTTNEAADSQVEYGQTTGYGSATGVAPALITAHSLGITGLQSSTLYHYRVKSRDAAGNLATSPDLTFTTPAPDTTPPVITNVTASAKPNRTVTVTWTTNERSTSQVQYGTSTSYGTLTPIDTSLVTSHSVKFTPAQRRVLYHYRVISTDAAGNTAVSPDFTFTST